MRALKRARAEIDLRPELYKPLYADMIPERYRARLNVRNFAPGERVAFLPYTEELFRRPWVGLALDPEWRLRPNQAVRTHPADVGAAIRAAAEAGGAGAP